MPKSQLNDPLVQAWILSHQVFNSLVKYEDAIFASSGLSPQKYLVLLTIKDRPEPVTQVDIGEWLDRNPNSTTVMLDRMVKDGLVERSKDLPDKRAVQIRITPRGEMLLKEGNQRASEVISDILSALSDRELRSFIRGMQKVRDQTYFKRRIKNKVELIESTLGEHLILFNNEEIAPDRR